MEETEESEPKEDSKKTLKDFCKNKWAVATIVLGVLLLLVLFTNITGNTITGSVIGAHSAGERVVDFAKAQGIDASLVETNENGNFYEVVISMEGQQVPVYVTKDGKFFTSSLIPLTGSTTQPPQNQQPPTDVPKSDKPEVELFVMSYCPYGTQAEKGIIPVVNLLKDKIDFKLKFVSYLMHGEDEAWENTRDYCIQKEQPDKFIAYMTCFLEAGDSESCLTKSNIDTNKLNSCTEQADTQFSITANLEDTDSYLSGRFPLFDIDKADNEKYQIGGSPGLVINGVQISSARDPTSYLNTICSAFNTPPEECSQQLSTTTPSPMWGWDDSGTPTDAQC